MAVALTATVIDPWARLTRWLSRRVGYGTAYSLLIYLATRLAVGFGFVVAYLLQPRLSWHRILVAADGWWYQFVAQHGYGTHIRTHVPFDRFHSHYSAWAFYPGYPLLIRAVHEVTRLRYSLTAFLLAFLLAGAAVRAVYALGEAYAGPAVARGSVVLFAGWPGSAAMNLPYSEGLFIAATAASLTALLKRQWLLAGALGAVATCTRAVGLALVVAALVAATREWIHNHDWRGFIAPVVAASGVGAYYAYAWWRTGDPLAWRHAEDRWHQHLDFRAAVGSHIHHDFAHRGPRTVTTLPLLVGPTMVILMAVAAAALHGQTGVALLAYAGVAGLLVLAYGRVGHRPRTRLDF